MNIRTLNVSLIVILLLIVSCDKKSDDLTGTSTGSGLSTSSSSLVVLAGGDGRAVIGGGKEPYSVVEIANSTIVSAQMATRELQIMGLSLGTTIVKVKDSSAPAKTVTVTITVKSSYTTGTAGSVSFTSNRGNYSVSGIGEFGMSPPVAGQGALALQDFESLFILAYKVNSPTNLDMTLIGFNSNTSDYSGTFYYPGSGKVVNISYFPGTNPNDTTFLEKGYLLSGSATAVMESFTSASMKGTFSGIGYFYNNGAINTSQGISLTNGTYNVPIVHTGLMADRSLQKNVSVMVKKIMERHTAF